MARSQVNPIEVEKDPGAVAHRDAMAKKRGVLTLLLPLLFLLAAIFAGGPAAAQDNPAPFPSDFKQFLAELWPDAEAQGIARATFDLAFQNLAPDPRVMALTRSQPEYGKPFGDYVNAFASPARIDNGSRKAAQWSEALDAIERKFGVDRFIVLAIWGLETSYGSEPLRWNVIGSLATLAQARYREPYFRDELLAALKIVRDGHLSPDRMLGSWAGAMGQTQFMPSSFLSYAVAYSGSGSPDIWTKVPDVLASIANYFHERGWKQGLTWGFEVVVPDGFDYRRSRASFSEWAGLGLKRADGGDYPATGEAILFFPSGASGPAFLVTENFIAIKRYNNSDAYALSAGYLADRLRGASPIRAPWPQADRQLTLGERIALQRKLAELGYHVNDFQGRIDFDLRDVIREVQVKFDMVPDGFPTLPLLDKLVIPAK
jgi:membrane-bound lytic murein transglycosylase B